MSSIDIAELDRAFEAMEDDDPLIGSEIGNRYRIEELLGMGGMGSVYAATQVQIERPVAIKVMRIVDSTAMERFRREAVTIGKLGHPNIISIYDVGRLPDGRPYMVMPRVTGPDLGELIEEGQLFTPDEVVPLLRGPASALDTMHSAGFVHRDIKPDNLMIDELSNGQRRVLLLDFGLTQMMVDERARLTRDGLVSGTPHYISPEGAHGHKVTGVSDVYSLAAVAFELMTGTPPFDADSPVQILVSKAQEDPPTLASKGVFASERLEEVMATGLAREPENRYGRAAAFVDALEAAARGWVDEQSAVHSRPPGNDANTAIDLEPVTVLDMDSSGVSNTAPRVRDSAAPRSVAPDEVAGLSAPRPWRWVALGAIALGVAIAVGVALNPPDDDAIVVATRPSDGSGTEPADDPDLESVVRPEPAPVEAAAETDTRPDEPTETPAEATVPNGAQRGRRARAAPSPAAVTATRPEVTAPPTVQAPPEAVRPSPPAALPAAEGAPDPDLEVARSRVQEGTRALMAGMLPRAIERFREATIAAPRHAPAWRGLGLANERLRRTAEAQRAYRRYLMLAPAASDATEIASRLRRLDEANVLASEQ